MDHAQEAGDHASRVFPPFDPSYFASQLFWLAVTFGVLYFIMSRIILPKIQDGLERRADKLTRDLDEAAAAEEKASQAQHDLEIKLAAARARARETAARTRAEVESEVAAETARVESDAEKRIANAAIRIAEAQAEAMKNVETVAASAASAIVEKLSGLSVTEDEARAAVSRATQGS